MNNCIYCHRSGQEDSPYWIETEKGSAHLECIENVERKESNAHQMSLNILNKIRRDMRLKNYNLNKAQVKKMSDFLKALESQIEQHSESIESVSGGKVGGIVIINAKTKNGSKWRLKSAYGDTFITKDEILILS